MSLQDLEYDNDNVVGSARRKSRFPRKILRVILSDGTCKLQPQITYDIKVKEDEEEWDYYSNGNNNYNHGNNYKEHCQDFISTHNQTTKDHVLKFISDPDDTENRDQLIKVISDAHCDTENTCHDSNLKVIPNPYYDTENRYYDSKESLVHLDEKKIKIKNNPHLNSRLTSNDVPPRIKPKDRTRPHKHQHPEPTPEFPYQCDTCDMLFKTLDLLTDHQNSVHHNNRQFSCRYCCKRFNDKYNMRKHVLIHVGEKRHRCQFCDKAFLRKDHLRSHLQTHYNRKFGCKICGKSFRTLDLYQRHAKSHKEAPSLSLNEKFENSFQDPPNPTKLDNSIPIHNESNGCHKEENGTKIYDNDNASDSLHISNVKSKVESFPVTILDEDLSEFWKDSPSISENDQSVCSSSPVNSDHNHSFLNGDSPQSEVIGFSCQACGATFKTELSLQMHSQKCNAESRHWQCMKCNIIFDESKTLKQHYEKVHSAEKPIPSPSRWRCKTCNINYPNSKELSRHYAQAHKDAQIFPCSECPKTFTVWHNLKKHMLIHLGDKKHKCTVCEKGFVRKDHLNSHMKVHLGDGSKFTCPVCCKVFRLKQMYLKHMNLHGLEQSYDEK